MISALLYLQYYSVKNRLLSRLKRLKQPKYLFGAIVGGIYFYFYFFRYFFHARGQRQILNGVISPENLFLLESLGALALLVIVLSALIFPRERAALTFTEAEVAFLFPAPISRRGLIHFKLLRSQTAILFTVFFLMLFSNRYGGNKWIHAAGWWLILSTLSLHLLGSSFARTMLLERGISNWKRRLIVLGFVIALAAVVIVWAKKTIPGFNLSEMDSFAAAQDYARQVLISGPMPYLLYPFRLVVRPLLAPGVAAFFQALGPALLLMLLHYGWVVRSNVAFEEASVEASRKLAEKVAAMRAGNWRGAKGKQKSKRPPFKLAALGPQPTALFWKNLISAGQIFTSRIWIFVAVFAIAAYFGTAGQSHGSNVFAALGMIAGMLLIWSLLLGPQILRQDLRQDLPLADILKMYPMRGWQIVLGELLAPAAILTGAQWLLLIFAAGLLSQFHGKIPGFLPAAIVLSAAIILPMLDVVLLLIPNAGVLLFPAWFQAGKDSPRGIEATGQRLILMFGQLLAFAIALIPAAIFFAVVFFVGKIWIAPVAVIPLASLVAAIILAAEAALGVMWLGWLFERFDLSAELPA